MIELCARCMKPINTRREPYYTANYFGISERYYLHPVCYDEIKDAHKDRKICKP